VAKVGSSSITKAAVEHWMSVLIVTDTGDIPKTTDPKLVVPQAPSYAACITHAGEGLAHTNGHLSVAAIKEKCARLRQALKEQALETLISADQLIGKSAERGVTVSNSQVRQRLDQLNREEFPNQAAYRRYLRRTRQSVADQLYRVKTNLLAGDLIATATGGPNHTPSPTQQREFADLSNKWIAATDCRPDYLVALCSQYKPSAAKPPAVNVLIAELAL
jgi:hypothetical protein